MTDKIEKMGFGRRAVTFLRDLSVENLSLIFEFGIPRRMGTIFTLRETSFGELNRPVFFLSTGRCGTNWFQALLSLDKNLKVVHEPQPNLAFQNKFARRILSLAGDANEISEELALEAMKEIFTAGREKYLRYCYKTKRRFVETNHYQTFFAPAIAQLIPDSIFVHVYRHPGEFVRSAIRRGWYTSDNMSSPAFPEPFPGTYDYKKWQSYSLIQKNAWLWRETNMFIENFKKRTGQERVFTLDFSNFNITNILGLVDFAGADISHSRIKKQMNRKVNVQKTGDFPKYKDWSNLQKKELADICTELALTYGYKLSAD
ncbi:sulfotransferase [bacterium]|nr:sulfotransferase [bacterium]